MTDERQEDAGQQPAPEAPRPRRRPTAVGDTLAAADQPASPWLVPGGMSLAEHFGRFQCITPAHAAALRAPLPAESVQKATAKDTGKKYDATGHGYQWVADRLSEVFGPGGWTEDHENMETTGTWGQRQTTFYHIVCRMTLQVGRWLTPEADGAGVIPTPVFCPVGRWISYGEHRADNRGDARKGAQTNALKKVAAYALGVGADAFRGSIDDDMAGQKPGDDPRQRQQRPAATPADRATMRQAQAVVDFKRATRPGPCCLCEDMIQPGEWVAYPVAHPYTGRMRAAHVACYDREFPEKAPGGRQAAPNGSGGATGQVRQPAGSQRAATPPAGHPASEVPPPDEGGYDGTDGQDATASEPDPDDILPF